MGEAAVPSVGLSESSKRALEAFTGMRLHRSNLPVLAYDLNALEVLAGRVRTLLVPELIQAIKAVRAAGEGEVFDRFVAQTAPFVELLDGVADVKVGVAQAMRGFLNQMELTDRQALVMFVFMMTELAVAFAMAFFLPVEAAAHIVKTRTIIQTILRSSMVRAAASSTAIQMLFMPGSSLLAQISMLADGLMPGVDWAQVGKQALYGLAVAGVTTAAGPALGRFAGVVGGALAKFEVSDATRNLLTSLMMVPVSEIGLEVVGDIAASYIVDGTYDPGGLGMAVISGALSGSGELGASGAGAAARRVAVGLGFNPTRPRWNMPAGTGFTADGRPVAPVTPAPSTYQPEVDDPAGAGSGGPAPVPVPLVSAPALSPPAPAAPEPMPVPAWSTPALSAPSWSTPDLPVPSWSTPDLPVPSWSTPDLPVPSWSTPDLPVPSWSTPDLPVPSWSVPNFSVPTVPVVPVPEWVAVAGAPVVEQWQRFQRELVDHYGGLLAGTGQARQFLAALPVPVEQVFTEWAATRQNDPAVPAFLSRIGLPATALTGQYLTGVRDQAVARITEALAQSVTTGGPIPAAVRPEQVVAALPAEFDRQALRAAVHLAAQHHIDQYLTTGTPATATLPDGVVRPGSAYVPGDAYVPGAPGLPGGAALPTAVGTSGSAGVPGGSGTAAVPSDAVRAAVVRDVRAQVDGSLDAILGPTPPLTAPLTVSPSVLPAAATSPGAAQVNAVADVVRQVVTDLPARFTAATVPDSTGPDTTPSPVDTPASRRTDVPVTPEQHTPAAASLAQTQFTALADQYGVEPARHDALARSFQRDWVDGYHQVLAQATGSATPATPHTPGTSGMPSTPGAPDAAGGRSTVPGGVAPRTDGTLIHDNASDRTSVSDMSVSSDDISDDWTVRLWSLSGGAGGPAGLPEVPDGPVDAGNDSEAGGSDSSADVAGEAGRGGVLLPSQLSEDDVSARFGWLGSVNPGRGDDPDSPGSRWRDSATNCVLAVIGTDMSLADGVVWQVPPEVPSPVVWLQRYAEGRPLVDVADYDAVVEVMAGAEPGARGVLVMTGEGDRVSHAVNVVRTDDGRVVFLDGQWGGLARGPVEPGRLRFVATTDGVGTPRPPSRVADDPTTTVPEEADLAGMDRRAPEEEFRTGSDSPAVGSDVDSEERLFASRPASSLGIPDVGESYGPLYAPPAGVGDDATAVVPGYSEEELFASRPASSLGVPDVASLLGPYLSQVSGDPTGLSQPFGDATGAAGWSVVPGDGWVVVHPDGVGAGVDVERLAVVAREQAVTDAAAWAARTGQDRPAGDAVSRVVLVYEDPGPEGVLDLVGSLLLGDLRSDVEVPEAAVVELSPYGADPFGVPEVQPGTLVAVAELRAAFNQSGAVAARWQYVADSGAEAGVVPPGLRAVDFSGRETFPALSWEVQAHPINEEADLEYRRRRADAQLPVNHGPYLLSFDWDWARLGQRAFSYFRDWVFLPDVPSERGLRVTQLRPAGLLAGEVAAASAGESLAVVPDVGRGWVPDGARVLVVGVPGPRPVHPGAVLSSILDVFLNGALPPAASGLREPVYVVVHGFGGWTSTVVLTHVAEDDLWPVRMGELAIGEPAVGGLREPRDQIEAEEWARVRAELAGIAEAVEGPGGAARSWVARREELRAALPDVTVTDPAVGAQEHRRVGERVDQLVALGERLVGHTRGWAGVAGRVPEVSDRWRAELFSAVSAFGLARQWLEEQISSLPVGPAALPGRAGDGATAFGGRPTESDGQAVAARSAEQAVSVSDGGVAAVRADLIRRWQALADGHARRMDAADWQSQRMAAPGQGDSPARSALAGVSDRYLQEMQGLSRARMPRTVDAYVDSLPATELGGLGDRLGQVETAAAELDRHLEQARAAAGTPQISVVSDERGPLTGHDGPVWAVTSWLGESGPRVASASDDGTVRIWDVASGQRLVTFEGHDGPVSAVASWQAGAERLVASAGNDGMVLIWDAASGVERQRLEGHDGSVSAVASWQAGPDRLVASASMDGSVLIWDAASGVERRLDGHEGAVLAVTSLQGASGPLLVSADSDGLVLIWDANGGVETGRFTGHDGPVFALTSWPSESGPLVASASADGTVRIWNADSGALLWTLGATDGTEWAAVTSWPAGTGRLVAAASVDGTVRIWNADGELIETVEAPAPLLALTSWPAGPGRWGMAGGDADSMVQLWSLSGGAGGPAGLPEVPDGLVDGGNGSDSGGSDSSADVAGEAGRGGVLLPSQLSEDDVSARFGWLGSVNPGRGDDPDSPGSRWRDSATNCVLATIGTDMSLADGVVWQVPPEVPSPVVWLQRYAGRPLVDVADYDAVVEVMAGAEPGARGVLVTTGVGDEVSHAVNVVRTDDGRVVFLDGQRGGLARGPVEPGRLRFVATTDGVGTPRPPSRVADDTTVTVPEEADLAGMDGVARPPSEAVSVPVPLPSLPAGVLRSDVWDRLFAQFLDRVGAGVAVSLGERTPDAVRDLLRDSFDYLVDRTDVLDGGRAGLSPEDRALVRQALDARGTSVPRLTGALPHLLSEAFAVNVTVAPAESGPHENGGVAPWHDRTVALDLPVAHLSVVPDGRGPLIHRYDASAVASWQAESGPRVASVDGVGAVRIWDVDRDVVLQTLAGRHYGVLTSWQGRLGQQLMASAGRDGAVLVWDVDRGVVLQRLTGHTGEVVALTSWPAGAGRRLASAGYDGTVLVWDVDNGVEVRRLTGDPGPMALTSWPDEFGGVLASAGGVGAVLVWDVDRGVEVRRLTGHTGVVLAVTSWQEGAGRRVASGGSGGTVRIWDVDRGVVLQTLEGHDGLVNELTSWQDESGWRLLAAADVAGTVRIWDVDRGVLLQTLEGHDGVEALTLLPEGPGRWLLAVGQRRMVRLWSLSDSAPERFRTVPGRGSVVVYPEGVSAGIDVERLAVVAREQAVTDAEAWAARTGQDRPADDAVWRVVLAFEDRGHEDVLALAKRLIDGELGVEVPKEAVIELSPYGADPSVVPGVESRTLVEVAALRAARDESGAVAILGRHVADVGAGVVPDGVVIVDFSGRETFPALLWEVQAHPINEDADLDYRGRRRLDGLPVNHGPYLLSFDVDWWRFEQLAFSHFRDWVFLPRVPSERGLRVTQLRQAELLAPEILNVALGAKNLPMPDVGPVGWVPDGARVVVVGVPGPRPGDPKAVVPSMFDFLNGALPPAASGLREPVYVVVHGFGGWTSTVVLTHVAEDDLWPVRMGELVPGGPVGGGLRAARDLAEAEGWTRVLAEVERIAAAVGAAAPGRVGWAGELRAALPDVVGDPAAVDGQRRMGERVDQLVALGERLVGLTRGWTGEGALPVGTDRPDLRLERWAGQERNRRLAAAGARVYGVVAEEVTDRVEEEIDRVWDAVATPGEKVPEAVRYVLEAVYLGAWAFYTAPGRPVVIDRPEDPDEDLPEGVQREDGQWIVDPSAVLGLGLAKFDEFLADHGQDVAMLWSADGAVAQVSELRAALGVSPPVPHVRVVGRVPEVSEQWRAELFSAVSAFGLARQWLEEQVSSLPAAAVPGQAGDGAAGSGEQAVPVSDDGVATARADLIGRWRDLADGHARRMDAADGALRRIDAADRAIRLMTDFGQDHSGTRSALARERSALAGLSDRYLQEMQGLSRARMHRTVDAYVESLPPGELGGLGDRVGQVETAAAELDQHLGQAPDPSSVDVVDGVELRTLEGHTGAVWAVTSWPGEPGPRVASASDDGTVRIWDALTGAPLRTLRGHTDGVVAVESWQAGPDRRLATADMQGAVFVWDAVTGARLLTLRGHIGPVWAVTSWPGEPGPRVASASDDGTVFVWDAVTGARLLTLGGHTGGVGAVASWQAGADRRLASADWADGTVFVWDVASGARLLTLRGHTGGVVALASWQAGPDRRLASASWDGTVRVWDAVTGAPLLTLRGHAGAVVALASWQAGSERRLASASEDGTVRVWNVVTGAPLLTLEGHTGGAVAVTSWQAGSERRLTTADAHGTVRVWNADSGALLRTLEGHTGRVRTVTSLQGESGRRAVVSAGDDHTVRLWSLPDDAGGPAGLPGVPDGPVDGGNGSDSGGSDSSADVAGEAGRGGVLLPSQLSEDDVSARFGWLGSVNPGRGDDPDSPGSRWRDSATNCVLAVIGTDMSLADGVVWQVPPEVPSPVVWLQRYAEGRPLVDVADYDAVVEVMAGAEPGARGVLVMTGEGDRVSHAVNVVRTDGGKVVFLDGQRGGLARGPVEPGRLRFVATTDGVGVPRPPAGVADDPTTTVPEEADLAGMDRTARTTPTSPPPVEPDPSAFPWWDDPLAGFDMTTPAAGSGSPVEVVLDEVTEEIVPEEEDLAGMDGAARTTSTSPPPVEPDPSAFPWWDDPLAGFDMTTPAAGSGSPVEVVLDEVTEEIVPEEEDLAGMDGGARPPSESVSVSVPLPSLPAGLLRSDVWDRLFAQFLDRVGAGVAVSLGERTPDAVRDLLRDSFDYLVDRTDVLDGGRAGLSPEDRALVRQALDARGTSVPRLTGALPHLLSEAFAVNVTVAPAESGPHENGGVAPWHDRTVALDLPVAHLSVVPDRRGPLRNPHDVLAVASWQAESGPRVVTAGRGGTVVIWDVDRGVWLRTLPGHNGGVRALTLWQEGAGWRVAAASMDGDVLIWDVDRGVWLRTLTDPVGPVWALTSWQDPGRRLLATAGFVDQTVRIWDVDRRVVIQTLEGHTRPVTALTSWQGESGRLVASASLDGTVRIWHPGDGVLMRTLEGHTHRVSAVTSWQEGAGRRLASADVAGTVLIWDVDEGVVLRTLTSHTGPVRALTSWQGEWGQLLASASMDGAVRIWDAAGGVLLRTLAGHDRGVRALTSWPEGPGRRLLAAAGGDRAVRLWSLSDDAVGSVGLSVVSGERFRTESGRGWVVVYPEGVGAGVDVERLAAVAREQAVTDAEAWAARAGQDRPAGDAVWRVVVAFEDRGHEGVLGLVGRLLDGGLGVTVPEAAVIELSPYGADPSVVPGVESRTLVEVAALRASRGQSGAVAVLGRYVAGAGAGAVPDGVVAVDFSGRETFPALLREFQAHPINEDADLAYRGRRRLAGLPVDHGPYLLSFDVDWWRWNQLAFSHFRDWVFLPRVRSERGLRVTQLRQAELLADEIAVAALGESLAAGVPDVGPAWVPDGARVLVVGVPGPRPGDPKAVVPSMFDFLNGALPPAASGLREPVYVVVHGFGGWVSTVVLTHTAEDDLWPVRMDELAVGDPVGGGLRPARDLVEAEGWTRVLAEMEEIAEAVRAPGGAAARGRVGWAGELKAALPDVVGDPAVGVDGQRRMGERVDQLVALGERLVGLTRGWTGEGALPVGTDRPDLRLERWAGQERNRRLAAAGARVDGVVAEEVQDRIVAEIERVWDAVATPEEEVPEAVQYVLEAVYLGAWAFYTAPGRPVVIDRPEDPDENLPEGVQREGSRRIVDPSAVLGLGLAKFDEFLADHGQDVALLWSADGAAAQVSELRAALGVSPPVPHVRVVGRVPEVSEQWRAELFSAVSAFGLARQWLEERVSSLPVQAAVVPGQAGDGAVGSGEQTVPVSDAEVAAARADLTRRWETLVGDHETRMDRLQAAEEALRRLTAFGQDNSQARSVLAGLSDPYLGAMQGLSRARMPRTVDAYVELLPARELGGLGVRLGEVEAAAAELDQHLEQARIDADTSAADVVDGVERRTLAGHTDEVVAVTSWQGAAGPRVASASDDGSVLIWDAVSGERLLTLEGHTDGAWAVTSWQAGSDWRLASGSGDGTVRIWDAATGVELRRLRGHTRAVSAVTSWQAGSDWRVASASWDGTVRVWNAVTGERLLTLRGHIGAAVAVMSWQAGSDRLLASAGGWDGSVLIWNAVTGERLLTLEGHTNRVVALASWQAGSDWRVASASDDGSVRVWDAVTGERLLTLEGHTGGVGALASWQGESGGRLASASRDGTVRVWDATSGERLLTLEGHTGGAVALASWQAGSDWRVASASDDGSVRVWDAVTGEELLTLEGHTGGVGALTSLQGESGRRVVVSAGDDQTVRLWSLPDGAAGPAGLPDVPDGPVDAGNDAEPVIANSGVELRTLEGHDGVVWAVTSWQGAAGPRVASASEDGTVRIWDAARGERLWTLEGHTNAVVAVTSWQAGSDWRLASAGVDGTVRIWDAATGVGLWTLAGHTGVVRAVTSWQAGSDWLLASASWDGTVRIWNVATGVELRTLRGHAGQVSAVTSWQAGSDLRLASAGADRTVRIWDAATGVELRTLEGHTNAVAALASWQAGSDWRLASAGVDGTVRIWDAATGVELRTLEGHAGPVTAVASWRVGSDWRLASAGGDGTVMIWDADSGERLRTLEGHTNAVLALTLWQDESGWQGESGRRVVVSAGWDRTVRLWSLSDGAAGPAGLPEVPDGPVAAGHDAEPGGR
ncbi:toxin glutamine deamidase domain-containing protein [Micromonospora inyonensis]|uniref:WD40 repeat n=1 Tax=Micromonospora inyonensis TaxID=47866 RepID=A0A1C6SF32_9ACTN|nr:toxin glutamine deamidase domain-containing protein [Micromonospora inyonensis]SCL28095.1 WD40 repeat [Micromonospora inyonensis]